MAKIDADSGTSFIEAPLKNQLIDGDGRLWFTIQ